MNGKVQETWDVNSGSYDPWTDRVYLPIFADSEVKKQILIHELQHKSDRLWFLLPRVLSLLGLLVLVEGCLVRSPITALASIAYIWITGFMMVGVDKILEQRANHAMKVNEK